MTIIIVMTVTGVRFSKTVDESNSLIIQGRLGIQVPILYYDMSYHNSDHDRA